jgi:hypothetical protein
MTLSNENRSDVQNYMDCCLTEPYRCMCICVYKIQEAISLNEYIFSYKADKNKPVFKLGQKQFWNKELSLKTNNKRKGLTIKK